MLGKKWRVSVIVIIVGVIFIKWYTADEVRVEHTYSTHIYPPIGAFFRAITGWLPVSVGDILYGLIGGWLIFSFIKFIIAIFRRTVTWQKIYKGIKKTLLIAGIIYILFNLFWGINYDRQGIAYQLQLNMRTYSTEDLKTINEQLLLKVNAAKQALVGKPTLYPGSNELFKKVQAAYRQLSLTYPFLHYKNPSIKSSMWGWLGNYTGFTGYYNPFTGEAQVNTSVPKFLQPYIACHEVAHQLGYAKEMEANFVGYLAASHSTDTLLHYSVYLDLFLYSNNSLMKVDSIAAKLYSVQLLPSVKEDLRKWKAFNQKHTSFIEPFVRWSYAKYLQNNRQPQGMLAYNEVVSFLIAYYKKFGKI